MLQERIKHGIDSVQAGIIAGFTTGAIIVFLILLGIPNNIPSIALLSFLLVMIIFGSRLARRLQEHSLVHLLKNAVIMCLLGALIVLLFMSLINRWQEQGVDVKEYFYSINTETMTMLSGVPKAELHANPAIDPLTGAYPEKEPLRTNPMRLTLGGDDSLRFIGINWGVGGFYGLLLLLIVAGMAGVLGTWAAMTVNIGQYWQQVTRSLSGNPLIHWVILLLPSAFFALLWLTVGHGTFDVTTKDYSTLNPMIPLGNNSHEIQLLIGFGIIMWALVAIRAAQPNDWNLGYPMRLGICLGVIVVAVALGLWRIDGNKTYFIATSGSLKSGHRNLSILITVVIGLLLAAQNALALRQLGRFERQFAATSSLIVLLLMPLYLNQGQNDVMTIVGINVMLGLGLNIVVGYAGLLDLGYVAFFALGAYAYAFLSSNQRRLDENNQQAGLRFTGSEAMVIRLTGWVIVSAIVASIVIWVGIHLWRRRQLALQESSQKSQQSQRRLFPFPARPTGSITVLITVAAIGTSVIVASLLERAGILEDLFNTAPPFLIGLLVGVIVAGLSGIALGIPVLRLRGDYLAIVTLGFGEIIRLLFNNLREYTGGPQGILEIPRYPEGVTGQVSFLMMVYLVFIGVALVAFCSIRLKQSRVGRAWGAMRSDEDIAQSMGINLVQSKLTAFAIGAMFAGVGGVLFAARQRNIYPNDFKLDVSIEVLSLVIIGGMGSIPGVIMGAIALIGVPEVLRDLSTYRILAFGALLVTMVIIRPEGLLPAPPMQLKDRARDLIHKQHEQEGEQAS